MRYVLKVAYDGTEFSGWQCQKNARSVQEEIERAIERALQKEVRITGSGRTDAGVHAFAQICHFDLDSSVPPEKMPDCLNRFLPSDVRILEGKEGKSGFDANRSAKRKTYCYTLYESERENPLTERFAVRLDKIPSLAILREKARLLEGTHDYKAFCASGSSVKTTVRTVYEVRVEEEMRFGVREIKLYVTGNGFLYNMVRTMVGELLDLATEKRNEESLKRAFESGERELLARTMPAKGLMLWQVVYEE